MEDDVEKGVQEEKAGDLDGRGEKEKDDDRLVILRLHECGRRERRRSAQAAVKGWMAVNGFRPTSAYKHLKPRRNVRLTEEGEWGKEKAEQTSVVNVEVEVEVYFEAEGKGYVGYMRMDRVPRRTVVEGVEGGGEGAEDQRYLTWVVLGLRQLEEKKRARRREKQKLRKGEGKADVRKRAQEHESESEGVVYLVVVPRGKVSAIRLYTGSVSRRVLEEGKGKRAGLLRQASLRGTLTLDLG